MKPRMSTARPHRSWPVDTKELCEAQALTADLGGHRRCIHKQNTRRLAQLLPPRNRSPDSYRPKIK
jgi:hypothetical protein